MNRRALILFARAGGPLLSGDMPESPLRDLARRLRETAQRHIAFSQVVDLMRTVDDHINMMALIEETNSAAFGPIKPHIYSPDYQAMGDCRVCGHCQEKPWHIAVVEKQ